MQSNLTSCFAVTRKRYTWVAKSLLAQLAYFSMLALLWRLNAVATLWVFVVPFFASSFALMFGNWYVWGPPASSECATQLT